MTFSVAHQKPAILDPVHAVSPSGVFDPIASLQQVVIDPLLEPLQPGIPVSLTDSSGNDVSGDLPTWMLRCLGDTVDPAAETTVRDLLGQTLVHFDRATPLPVGELFAVQAGERHSFPAPTPSVMYAAHSDVTPAAKNLLNGAGDEHAFFASLAYAYHPNTLGVWFQTSSAFTDFTAWMSSQIPGLHASGQFNSTTIKLLNDFCGLTLTTLTESLRLRLHSGDANEEFSFPRVLISMLMDYILQQQRTRNQNPGAVQTAGLLPFDVSQLFCPETLVLVNVEAHARALPQAITQEWAIINQGLNSPVKIIPHRQLSKLTALPRAASKMAAQMSSQKRADQVTRSAKIQFRKQPPTQVDLTQDISLMLNRMGKVNRSQNVLRESRISFSRANRRDPMDFNKPGRATSAKYMPDLHLYVDTSGSISEANYQDAVMMMIQIAKARNVNIFFNSFSDILSQEVMLRVENRSTEQIWAAFRAVPKVSGGTNFKQIWDYINASPRRKRRMSLMITDFEWSPPSSRVDHPRNLYYAPCSAMDWPRLIHAVSRFNSGMQHIDPTIRLKLLGVNA